MMLLLASIGLLSLHIELPGRTTSIASMMFASPSPRWATGGVTAPKPEIVEAHPTRAVFAVVTVTLLRLVPLPGSHQSLM